MQVLASDGTRIDASVRGIGRREAVVLVHGFPFHRALWEPHAQALAASHAVLCVDLRGAGSSGVPAGPYLMETLAGDVAALLDAAGIERVSLAGHSMGGYVALAFARMFSERVERLALVSSRLRDDTPQQAAARRELADRAEKAGSIEPILEAYVPRLTAPQTRSRQPGVPARAYEIARENSVRGAAAALRGMALRANCEDIAPEVDVPVLVLSGACDELLSLEESAAIAQRFPQGRLVVCDESGHLPMLEEPDRVTAALAQWLA